MDGTAAELPTPPPLLTRPKAMFYLQGINGQPVPVPALYDAIFQNDKQRVRDLLEHGANPNEMSPNGDYPLSESTVSGKDPAICRLLVEHGADVNVINPPNQQGWQNK